MTLNEQDLLRRKEKVKRIIQNGNFVQGSFPKHTEGQAQKSGHLAFFKVSLLLVDLYPDNPLS